MNQRLAIALFVLCVPLTSAAAGENASDPARDFVAPGPAEPFAEPLAGRVAAIPADPLGSHVGFLASPALEGRGLGTPGLAAASEYAAAQMKAAGIEPFGSDAEGKGAGWFQLVPIRQMSGVTGQLEIERRSGESSATRVFTSGVDCVFPASPPQSLTAPVVFAGYGIREPKLGRDDYAGLDVRGRVVVIFDGLPPGAEWQTAELVSRYAADDMDDRYEAKLETARGLGAVAVLAIEGDAFATSMRENLAESESAFRPYDRAAREEPPPLVRISGAAGRAILGDAALDGDASALRPGVRPGIRASIRIAGSEQLVVERNAIGILRGADPNLRDEAVVIGAHIDHLGRTGDGIHPGADDNASGVAALLEIAKSFASSPVRPKRTVVFALWTGEEEGKFGSGWYVRYPRWPLQRTAAYLNLDMIAHPWLPEEIRKLVSGSGLPDAEAFLAGVKSEAFVEPGVPRGVPALETALRNSARGNGLAMHIDWTDGKHGGSDYRDFARAGVPFIRFFGNFFADYHKPGDTADRVDPAQIQRVARFAMATAWQLANP